MGLTSISTRPAFDASPPLQTGSSAVTLIAAALVLSRLNDVQATLAVSLSPASPRLIHGGPGTGMRLAMAPPVPPLYGPRDGPLQGLRPGPNPPPAPAPAPPPPPTPPPPAGPPPSVPLPQLVPWVKPLTPEHMTGGPGSGGPNPFVEAERQARQLQALQQARTPDGRQFAPTPTLGPSNVVPPAPGPVPTASPAISGQLPTSAPSATPAPPTGDSLGDKARRQGGALFFLAQGEIGSHLPPPKKSLAGDILFAANIVGNNFAGGTISSGNPVGGVVTATIGTFKYIIKAVALDSKNLSSPPVQSIAERDPNPTGDPLVSLRIKARNGELFQLPQTVGPARDC